MIINFMVKVYISLPNETYKFIKKILKERKITFSKYTCDLIDADRDFRDKFPFLKYAGTFYLGPNASNNEEIDNALCDEIEGKI